MLVGAAAQTCRNLDKTMILFPRRMMPEASTKASREVTLNRAGEFELTFELLTSEERLPFMFLYARKGFLELDSNPLQLPSASRIVVYIALLGNKLPKMRSDVLASEHAISSGPLVRGFGPFLIVVCHLEPCPSVPTLDIEPFIRLAAIQYALVAPHLPCQIVQSLYESQSQLLALLIFCNCDIFDVAHETEAVDKLAFNDHRTCTDHRVLIVADYEDIVGVVAGCHEVVTLIEFRKGRFADSSQDSERREKAWRMFLLVEAIEEREYCPQYRHGSRSVAEGA